MDYHRRNRRGRPRSRPGMPVYLARPAKCSVFNGFCNFFVISSLIVIIYLMLDFHCNSCNKKCDIYNITKGLEDIARNISNMKGSYSDLERQIMKFSEEVPKIEGQIEILETLANTIERGDFIWNPKTHLPLPDVDVSLNKIKTNKINIIDAKNPTKESVENEHSSFDTIFNKD